MAHLVIDRALTGNVSNTWPRWEEMLGNGTAGGFVGSPKRGTAKQAIANQQTVAGQPWRDGPHPPQQAQSPRQPGIPWPPRDLLQPPPPRARPEPNRNERRYRAQCNAPESNGLLERLTSARTGQVSQFLQSIFSAPPKLKTNFWRPRPLPFSPSIFLVAGG